MQNLTLETIPQAIANMAEHLNLLEKIITQGYRPDTSKKKYKLPEAAEYCNMAVPTFRTHIYRRDVAGIKVGRNWLFLERDLDKFIEDFRRPTAKELEKEAFHELTK